MSDVSLQQRGKLEAQFDTLEFLSNQGYEALRSSILARDIDQSRAYASRASEFYRSLRTELQNITGDEFNSNTSVKDSDSYARYNLQVNIGWHISSMLEEEFRGEGQEPRACDTAEAVKKALEGKGIPDLAEPKPDDVATYGNISRMVINLCKSGKYRYVLEVLEYVRDIHPKPIVK